MEARVRDHVEYAVDSYLEIATEANGRASHELSEGNIESCLRFLTFAVEHAISAIEALALTVRNDSEVK